MAYEQKMNIVGSRSLPLPMNVAAAPGAEMCTRLEHKGADHKADCNFRVVVNSSAQAARIKRMKHQTGEIDKDNKVVVSSENKR